jgi:hypothetical protein
MRVHVFVRCGDTAYDYRSVDDCETIFGPADQKII